MKTIAAISTATSSAGGIGIVRMSGERALETANKIFKTSLTVDYTPSKMYLGQIQGEIFKEKAYMVYFKAPHSFTGEDVVEFHCHGGKGILQAVLRLLLENGATAALPGEFTKRAFLNGKMTLDAAEGVGEMISAESETAMLQAYRLMEGGLASRIEKVEDVLQSVLARVEGSIDYPDELGYTKEDILPGLISAQDSLDALYKTAGRGRLATGGVHVAIVGGTNVGKSSLLNALVGADRAIVTDIEGTTRDTLDVKVAYRGVTFVFTDTAGLRESEDVVEREGIKRSKTAVLGADTVVAVLDATDPSRDAETLAFTDGKKRIIVLNKTDVTLRDVQCDLHVSAKTGAGLSGLLELLYKATDGGSFTDTLLVVERHVAAVKTALDAANSAVEDVDKTPEVVALSIRIALNSLAELTGKSASENTVDQIFKRFCVGK